MYGGEEMCMQDFGGGTNLEDLSVDGRILLKWIFEQYNGRNAMGQDRNSGGLL
jgi:hypothetical protein